MALTNSNTIICHLLPGPHLYTWVESSNVDKLPCWRTKVPRQWWDSNPGSQRESRVNTSIYHGTSTSCVHRARESLPWSPPGIIQCPPAALSISERCLSNLKQNAHKPVHKILRIVCYKEICVFMSKIPDELYFQEDFNSRYSQWRIILHLQSLCNRLQGCEFFGLGAMVSVRVHNPEFILAFNFFLKFNQYAHWSGRRRPRHQLP